LYQPFPVVSDLAFESGRARRMTGIAVIAKPDRVGD
jgi:hypothetical protein